MSMLIEVLGLSAETAQERAVLDFKARRDHWDPLAGAPVQYRQ